jgi:hypothetical protein
MPSAKNFRLRRHVANENHLLSLISGYSRHKAEEYGK